MIKIWLDDVRDLPQDEAAKCFPWVVCRTAEEAIHWLELGLVYFISFDHDLGEGKSGYDVAKWIEEAAATLKIGPVEWAVHCKIQSAGQTSRRR